MTVLNAWVVCSVSSFLCMLDWFGSLDYDVMFWVSYVFLCLIMLYEESYKM